MNNGSTPSRKVFLSSTTSDLVDYRVVAERVIRELNDEFSGEFLLNPSSMNTKTQTGERETAVEASRSYVRDADWIVLIVAWKYGFMPKPSSAAAKQSWEPCSVTEWEYREATTVAQPAKLCFVFMAGEQTDGELFVYRALEASRERINLADFKGLEGLAATKKLAEFKKHLRGGKNNLGQPFELFKNIEHFEQRLQKTLRNRIKEELRKLKGVDLGPVLMILGLLTPTRTFIETVTTLAKVKTLHDRLHKIRQFGIRMWREVTLPQWKSSGVVDDVIRGGHFEILLGVNTHLSCIEAIYASMAPDQCKPLHRVRELIIELDEIKPKKLPPPMALDRYDDLVQAVDFFASRVQKAFSECDRQMVDVARELESGYRELCKQAEVALGSSKLESEERLLVQTALQEIARLHARLQTVLEQHTRWQRVHDEMQLIDDMQPADGEASGRAWEASIASITYSNQDTRRLISSLTELIGRERLGIGWCELADKLQQQLDIFDGSPNIAAYESMRKAFDDLFHKVDEEALITVKDADGRCKQLEQMLRIKEAELKTLTHAGGAAHGRSI